MFEKFRHRSHELERLDTGDYTADEYARWQREMRERITRIVGPEADKLACTPEDLHRYLRLLTFSGSHAGIGDGVVLTPETIVDVVLYGVAAGRPASSRRESWWRSQGDPENQLTPENQMT